MQHLHTKLTQKYQRYNQWHQTKHHNKVHWGVLAIFTLLIFGTLSYAVSAYDAVGNELVQPASVSAMTPAQRAGNLVTSVKIKELEGKSSTNYPVTISQVFKKGDIIAPNITVKLNGQAISSQTNILRHYDDGSIKHALISLILPQINVNQELTLDLYNQDSEIPAGTNLSITDLLPADFDANIRFDFPDGTTKSLSVRDLIQNNDYSIRYQGPIASEFVLIGRPKDSQGNIDSDLQIEFIVRRYKGVNGAYVSVVVDNTFTVLTSSTKTYPSQSNGDIVYNTTISLGKSSPQIAYQKDNVTHYFAARWRKTLWENYVPSKVQIKPDINYLISTGAIPNYDISIIPAKSKIDSYYANWLTKKRDILENGIITPYMPQTGERDDIGPYPQWAVLYLFSQDPKIEEVLLNTADLGGSFSVHFKKEDMGRIYALNDNPQIAIADNDNGYHPLEKSFSTPLRADPAHEPSLAFIPYILTGDKYYLDEMYYWANYGLLKQNPAYRENEKGLLYKNQVRAQAWILRELADASSFAPDDAFEKDYFTALVKNNLLKWQQVFIGPPELNQFGWFGDISNSKNICFAPDAGNILSPWMQDFLIWSLEHAASLGYQDASQNKNWLMKFRIGLFTKGPDFDPMDGGPYWMPVKDKSGNPYSTWKELWEKTFYCGGGHKTTSEIQGHSYYEYARAVLTFGVKGNLPKAQEAYDFLASQLGDTYKTNLKWAFKAPSEVTPPPPDTVAPSIPTSLTPTPISPFQINLSWTASTDNVGVAGYKIYRDGVLVTSLQLPVLNYSDTGLQPSTTHTYTVSAFDAAGNESSQSTPLSATTLPAFKPSDLNQDTKTDQLDFDILKQNLNQTDKPSSDINQDSIVDAKDLGILMSEWTR